MPTLDRTRPCAEVWGADGFWYEQDGMQFGADGQPRRTAAAPEPEPEPAPEPVPARPAPAPAFGGVPKSRTKATQPGSAEVTLSDDNLKTMVEIAGGTWSGRDAALAFLKGET